MSDVTIVPGTTDLEPQAGAREQNFELLADVSLRITVEVGSASLTLTDLLGLTKGSVVELDREADALLDILANGKLIARGEVVAVDGRYGIRIAEIVDARSGADRRSADRGTPDRRAA
ncbi:flagellar motor switch protein FliN [Sphingomonas ginkgonis]|uniref:Flagellar motor switch protein FliN n=1 Tax=Sphingomonas ginkgonis TaxID=2315330 RepID=A0A429VCJ5_9SPHN|nr:flagellar motor switch protein FliN [Sphingomonas ginkgonis]RST31562.1 flagellar motor switch protein FliN [Sphingomonas ginkgonis]